MIAEALAALPCRDATWANIKLCPLHRLVQHVDGFHDVALTFIDGNRYRPDGLPDGFMTSFRLKNGKTDLLLAVPLRPPTIRERR